MEEKQITLEGSSEPYVRIDDLAKILDVKPDTIADWCRRFDDFPHLRLPGNIRVRISEVEEWLKQLKNRPIQGRIRKEVK